MGKGRLPLAVPLPQIQDTKFTSAVAAWCSAIQSVLVGKQTPPQVAVIVPPGATSSGDEFSVPVGQAVTANGLLMASKTIVLFENRRSS